VADPAGVSPNELRMLMALSGEGESAGHELAELMGMHAMNVSRSLSSLHEMGLVESIADPSNRRRKPFRLSSQGKAAFGAMEPDIARVADFLLGSLSPYERKMLKKLLTKIDGRIMAWRAPEHHAHVPRA
jgi:DNA-binding MarR family transcriptional regulator